MIFGVVFRVIGSNLEENLFLADFGQKAWTNPLGFWQNFKVVKNFCIGKRRREMMFRVQNFRVIGSSLEENSFLVDFGQKAWTTPLGLWSKFKFAKTFSIGKRRREMMFGVVFRVIGSNLK